MKRIIVCDANSASQFCSHVNARVGCDFDCGRRARKLENRVKIEPLGGKPAPAVDQSPWHVRFIGNQQAKMALGKREIGAGGESTDDWNLGPCSAQQIEMPARA